MTSSPTKNLYTCHFKNFPSYRREVIRASTPYMAKMLYLTNKRNHPHLWLKNVIAKEFLTP